MKLLDVHGNIIIKDNKCKSIGQLLQKYKNDSPYIYDSFRITNENLSNLNLSRLSVNNIKIKNTIFRNNNCVNSKYNMSEFINCKFYNCNFKNLKFFYSIFDKCVFINCNFENSHFYQSKFKYLIFDYTHLNNSIMEGIYHNYVNFLDVNLNNVKYYDEDEFGYIPLPKYHKLYNYKNIYTDINIIKNIMVELGFKKDYNTMVTTISTKYNIKQIIMDVLLFKLSIRKLLLILKYKKIYEKVIKLEFKPKDIFKIKVKELKTIIKLHNKYVINKNDKINAQMLRNIIDTFLVRINASRVNYSGKYSFITDFIKARIKKKSKYNSKVI